MVETPQTRILTANGHEWTRTKRSSIRVYSRPFVVSNQSVKSVVWLFCSLHRVSV